MGNSLPTQIRCFLLRNINFCEVLDYSKKVRQSKELFPTVRNARGVSQVENTPSAVIISDGGNQMDRSVFVSRGWLLSMLESELENGAKCSDLFLRIRGRGLWMSKLLSHNASVYWDSTILLGISSGNV
jgi:hypothetical protein